MSEFSIFEVVTMREAGDLYGVTPRAVFLRMMRHDNKNEAVPFLRRSGGTWLTTMSALRKVYGEPVEPRKDYEL